MGTISLYVAKATGSYGMDHQKVFLSKKWKSNTFSTKVKDVHLL